MEKRGSLKWFFVFFRAFYFLFFCRLAKAMPHLSSQPSLYNSSDPITLLSTGDFKQTVLATSNAWLIEFYSSWCGHCIDFAPAFRELANDVKDWETVIKIGAVDCAKDENSPICREYEVMAYPTLKFFPAFSTSSQLGILRTGTKKVDNIRQSMITFVENQFKEKAAAHHWPILSLLGNETIEQLFIDHFDHKTLVLIFEDASEQFWSRELILDFVPLKEFPPIRRVGPSRQDMIDKYNVKSLPCIVVVDKPGTQFDKLTIKPDRHLAGKAIKDFLHPELEAANRIPVTKPNKKSAGEVYAPRKNQAYMVDMEKGIYYSLSHEVILHKVISKIHFRSLKNYLDVLHAYFPGRQKVRDVIGVIRRKLSKYTGHIKGEEFAQLFDDAVDSEHPQWREEISEWKGCQGSKPHLRGYPCSLWTLWHTLTVSSSLNGGENAATNPRQVMQAMKGYIQYFFGCSHCSNHFVDMAEDEHDPIDKIESLDGSVLWLWAAHNRVNRRLAGDSTEDPQAPKVQYPTPEQCPSCQVDHKWNNEAVLKYFKQFYSASNISLDGLGAGESDLQFENTGNAPNVVKSGAISVHSLQWTSLSLTKIDISLCASIYLISAILLFFFLVKILMNRRYRKRLLGKF